MGKLFEKLSLYSWVAIALLCVGWLVVSIPWYYSLPMGVVFWWAWRVAKREQEARAMTLRAADVSELSPLAYEDYCALLLRDAGWRAHTTPRQDQGVDVIAVLRGVKVAIQCKKYASPVGNRAVQEVVAGRLHYGAQLAVVVSTAPYTPSARQLAASTGVLLLHHDQLPKLERLARIK